MYVAMVVVLGWLEANFDGCVKIQGIGNEFGGKMRQSLQIRQ